MACCMWPRVDGSLGSFVGDACLSGLNFRKLINRPALWEPNCQDREGLILESRHQYVKPSSTCRLDDGSLHPDKNARLLGITARHNPLTTA